MNGENSATEVTSPQLAIPTPRPQAPGTSVARRLKRTQITVFQGVLPPTGPAPKVSLVQRVKARARAAFSITSMTSHLFLASLVLRTVYSR